jgi:hypothetical protein
MKKITLILLMIIVASCNSISQLSFDKDLENKINLKFNTEKKPINLTEITDFEWDNYIVIGCYQIPREVGKIYNVDLTNISEYATSNDSNNLLVFIKNKKAIKICEIKINIKFEEDRLLKKTRL